MSSSPQDPPSPSTPPLHASTPIYTKKQPSLNVELPSTPLTPPINVIPGEPTLTPPPVSPLAPPEAGDVAPPTISHPVAVRPPQPVSTPTQHASNHPDGTSSDKSSETAVIKPSSCQLSRKESYKAQRQHYRREKKRAASALLHSIHDPSVVVLADWLKVRGSLKSWTKLWCVLKPGLLLLYKSPKAKSSHWVGTVLLTSCQVIERPSKKDGFCFKLYHPLEQSIWAPRGPHNETIGAVVQPLPTAHLIFRAPSQAAGHCWLDGLELALRCSNAMLRCGQPRAEAAADVSQPSLSHEELEKHFNEHGQSNPLRSYSTALLSVSDYTSNYLYQNQNSPKAKKTSKWTQFVESIDLLKDSSESEVERDDKNSFLDFLRKKETFDCNTATTSSVRYLSAKENVEKTSKSMTSSPSKYDGSLVKKVPILRCFDFDITKLQLPSDKKVKRISSPTNIIEDHLLKLVTSFPRRSSTPSVVKTFTKTRMQELRISGAKTDSDNEDYNNKQYNNKQYSNEEYNNNPAYKRKRGVSPRVRITKTTPSVEDYKNYSSSSTDDIERIRSPNFRPLDPRSPTPEKYSLIDYRKIPSVSYAALNQQRMGDRISMQNVYVAGQIVPCEETNQQRMFDRISTQNAYTIQ